jgi:hypothetical protein
MEEILWHRRESRRQTEKTNIFLQPREAPAYSKGWEAYRLESSEAGRLKRLKVRR